jgi:hypothetical protein
VTLLEDGITAAYGLKSSATSIADDIRYCTKAAQDMLAQARAVIDEQA